MVRMTSWNAFGASVRGATHEENGQPNQDSVGLCGPSRQNDFLVVAVSDGHGNSRSFRSARGAALATECARRVLGEFARYLGPDVPLSVLRRHARTRWPRAMIESWKKAVRADLAAHPFSPVDFAAFPEPAPVLKPGEELPGSAWLAYGATLVAIVVTPRWLLYSQLGDGDILTVNSGGEVARPLPRQHEFLANQTMSLCTQRAHRYFQVKVEPVRAESPVLVSVSTDGYANCFRNDEGFFKVGADLLSYVRSEGAAFVAEKLADWLRESSQDGSGDDITVGMVVCQRAMRPGDHS